MQVEGFPERTLSELGVEGPTAGFSRPPGGGWEDARSTGRDVGA